MGRGRIKGSKNKKKMEKMDSAYTHPKEFYQLEIARKVEDIFIITDLLRNGMQVYSRNFKPVKSKGIFVGGVMEVKISFANNDIDFMALLIVFCQMFKVIIHYPITNEDRELYIPEEDDDIFKIPYYVYKFKHLSQVINMILYRS